MVRPPAGCQSISLYLPVSLVWRFMPLSFASSQNSLSSTTPARNYDGPFFIPLKDFSASIKVIRYRPARSLKSHLTPPHLHIVHETCAPHELERIASIDSYCVNHPNRFLFDPYAVSHPCLQELFPIRKRASHPRSRWNGSSDPGLPLAQRLSNPNLFECYTSRVGHSS